MTHLLRNAAVCAVLSVLTGCEPFAEHGNGSKTTRAIDVGAYSSIQNSSEIDVAVTVGEGESKVALTIDENLQQLVKVEVRGGVLYVETPAPISYRGEGRVTVSTPSITGAALDGSGELTVEGRQLPAALALRHDGSGSMRACIDASSLTVSHDGSGALEVCVPPGSARLSTVDVTRNGSGHVTVRADADSVTVAGSGSGAATLEGTANTLFMDVDGSGFVNARSLVAVDAELLNSGSGSVNASVSHFAKVQLYGSGNIEVWGDGALEIEDLGSGNVVNH